MGAKIYCGSVSKGSVMDFWLHELGFVVGGACGGGELVDSLPTRELRTRSSQSGIMVVCLSPVT